MSITHDTTRSEPAAAREGVATSTAFTTCPLCEATCGLELDVQHDHVGVPVTVRRVRGDRADVFSQGYLCPKGSALGKLHDDPDRLRTPLLRRPDGTHAAASWAAAYDEIGARYEAVTAEWGRDAVAVYSGNPTAHNLAHATHGRAFQAALGTRQRYSASTVDQMPKQVASALLFGTAISVPIPDVDRTDLLVLLGADPVESNGSLLTAPGLPDRLRAIKARGGRIVVIDPRRSRTAELAGEHLAIRPGADALLLLAIAHVLLEDGLADLGRAAGLVDGLDRLRGLCARFSPEVVAPATSLDPVDVRRLAADLARTPKAAVYGRIGTCTQAYGTLASWAVDVVNLLAGNLDVEGGALFTKPLAGAPHTEGTPGRGRGFQLGMSSNRTRVRGLPAVMGELPVACLAEEIDVPVGADDHRPPVRGLFVLGGNPVVSTPNAGRLDAALATLDCMVSVDLYLNETSRHAQVVLPAPSPLQRPHYDVLLYRLAIRNTGSFSPAVLPLDPDQQPEWEILLRLASLVSGAGWDIDLCAVDDAFALGAVEAQCRPGKALAEAGVDEVVRRLAAERRTGPERILDLLLRSGPYGDRFGPSDPLDPATGLSLATLEAHPHGVDLGALEPRLPEVLRTADGRIDIAPQVLVDDARRLDALLVAAATPPHERPLVLVGRRDLRSNNSWMHNVEVLVKGKPRCLLHVHPSDATRLGLVDGGSAKVTTRVGALVAPVRVTDGIRPGVVSLPHGWGHDAPGTRMGVAEQRPGVNSNVLTDELELDPLSGNAVLSGIPVEVSPA